MACAWFAMLYLTIQFIDEDNGYKKKTEFRKNWDAFEKKRRMKGFRGLKGSGGGNVKNIVLWLPRRKKYHIPNVVSNKKSTSLLRKITGTWKQLKRKLYVWASESGLSF